MAERFAERMRARESRSSLLPTAATPSYTRRSGAVREDSDSPVRTPFQRDRDRVVHSKAFRRLKHKTQVFVAPEGDHYRTRLTHTLEACGIARTVARALGLNEDLTEAIGLGHDLGHPPFGHAGEEALDGALRERCDSGFKHNEHSLRVVEVLERDGRGLNLTEQVRDGILNHTGSRKPATLEGRIVKLVDRVAYINHDIDDALRAGVLRPEDLPTAEIALLGPTGSQRIDTLVRDIVEHAPRPATSPRARQSAARCCACASSCSTASTWGRRRAASTSGSTVLALFDHYCEHPDEVPELDPRRRRLPARCRLPGRDDRSLLHRQVHRADYPRGGEVLMALISTESLERVKQTADIVEVISAHTDLRRQGARWVGLCPFHEERTPSFSVDAQEKLYHCFGCGVGGDTIKFVEEKEGLGFKAEAVELLADRYGVELEREDEGPASGRRSRQQRRRLGELLDRTATFYSALSLGLRRGGKSARVPGRARSRRGGAESVRGRLRAERLGQSAAARPTCGLQGRGDARRRAGAEGEGRGRVRPLPLAKHLPGSRPPWARAPRLRRARAHALRPGGAKYLNTAETAETDFFHKSRRCCTGSTSAQGRDRQGGKGA